MAADLSNTEQKLVKEFLETVGTKDTNNGPIPYNTAVKFLMARKFDVNRAVNLYFSHDDMRQREGLDTVNPIDDAVKRELLTEKFTILPGRDNHGAVIALFTARWHDPAVSTHQDTLRGLVFQLDVAIENADAQRNGLVFIYDMTHSKYGNFDYDLSIKILNMLKGCYPARLKKVLIVTAPLWFKAPFKILRLFVREKLRDRVYTANVSQLPTHVPTNSLPRRLGGHADMNHRTWIAQCLQVVWGKHMNIDTEIASYFENTDPPAADLSISSVSTSLSNSVDEHSIFSSDMESETSRNTITEKQNIEYKEKEFRLARGDSAESPPSSPTVGCKRGSDTSPSQIGENGEAPLLVRKRRPPGDGDSVHGAESGGLNVKDLVEYSRIKGQKGLVREYQAIKAEPPQGSFEASKAKQNLPKNRYTDVLCLDHSRVKLSTVDDDPYSDYINANFVDGYRQKNAFISTQGPLPRTFEDFWRMVWEQMVLIVVMTTRTVERSRLKCGQYWPLDEEDSAEYGDFTVVNSGCDRQTNYNVTTLVLHNNKTRESREVTHFQFVSWPDYGVPASAAAFLDFMFHVRDRQHERVAAATETGAWSGHRNGPPIVIHCSAGIGRTGTFITMDILTRRLDDVGTVEVERTVRRLRAQRAFSIQMPEQYVFVHLALIEHAQRQGLLSDVSLDGFHEDSSSDDDNAAP